MLWLIDTNILISASLFPASVPAQAFMKAVSWPHEAMVCQYSIDEMRNVYKRKFPGKLENFDIFARMLLHSVEIAPTPPDDAFNIQILRKVQDRNDWPILIAAVSANAHGIITGDRHFLESGISSPQMIAAAEFIKLY